MVAFGPGYTALDRAEQWLDAQGIKVTPEMGLGDLQKLIDFAYMHSFATDSGHTRESVEIILTAQFEGD
jgi:hypothetical protein